MITLTGFLVGLVNDRVYTKYLQSVQNKKAFLSANLGLLLGLMGLFTVYMVFEQYWYGVAANLAGGWVGQYYALQMPHLSIKSTYHKTQRGFFFLLGSLKRIFKK